MSNLYNVEYFASAPPQPEAGRVTELAIRLGMRAIKSQATSVANVEVPENDAAIVLGQDLPICGLNTYSRESFEHIIERRKSLTPEATNVVRRVWDSFDAVLQREASLYGLHRCSETRIEITDDREDVPSRNDWHIDASQSGNAPALRPLRGWQSATAERPRLVRSSFSEFGVVRYVMTIGEPEGGTEFALGNYCASDIADVQKMRASSTQFASGDVVRFSSERAIHARSSRTRPRIFLTSSLLRQTQKEY